MQRRDDLLMRLLAEAMQRLGLDEAEKMAAHVGEEYGRSLAARMTPTEGQRTIRAAMHVVADTLTAHGFAAHAEDRGETTAVVAEQCPFGNASTTNPVLCAVDRGMVTGLLAGLCGRASERALPVILSSRARGDAACTASA
jgi:predicted ArsR family transcriptional regulator